MSDQNPHVPTFLHGVSRLPSQQRSSSSQLPSDLQPLERQPQTEAPSPPPTISLNIGASRPFSLPAPPVGGIPGSSAAPGKGGIKAKADSAQRPTPGSYSLDRAKNDTAVIAHEVRHAVDEATLKDLYGAVKEHLNIVFIGHVDAGKSTLGGNLLYLCGTVDKRTLEKYEREAKEAGRESWYLSWALDSTPQERAKGKTVEVGRAYFETSTRRYTILDAPGHKTYVPSMISGAAQADVAVLVISARRGEFETGFEKGGQTREHILLVKTAGVTHLVCVVNKMDEPTVRWDQVRFDAIVAKMTPFVRAAGFSPPHVTFIPVSAYTGANLKERVERSTCPWWSGESLLGHLDVVPMVERKLGAPAMVPVSEKYKDLGTVVVGKVESGVVRKGDTLLLMPNKNAVEVAAIHNELEEEVNQALCGDNVRIRLRGVDDEDIHPGFVLTSPVSPVHAVRQFEAQLAILEHKNIICPGYTAVMHCHTLAEEVTLSALLHYFDKATGRKSRKPPQFAKRGQKIVALIETAQPICIERFADYPQLGRFTLRDEGRTVAIGKITKLIERDEEIAEGMASLNVSG
ncbi:TEF1 family protein [Phanerochaete sordida]|uniref:Eukaryotic peptide chain release factor GTP-binding subunit n=1 Tax=Phanerochaete sordida TaxID=48140 RepID=A0A9P3LAF6_9APHY|nr:TEF1 family protein [Phanerochaete sordida]